MAWFAIVIVMQSKHMTLRYRSIVDNYKLTVVFEA